jgi:hypothetical protein
MLPKILCPASAPVSKFSVLRIASAAIFAFAFAATFPILAQTTEGGSPNCEPADIADRRKRACVATGFYTPACE